MVYIHTKIKVHYKAGEHGLSNALYVCEHLRQEGKTMKCLTCVLSVERFRVQFSNQIAPTCHLDRGMQGIEVDQKDNPLRRISLAVYIYVASYSRTL